MEGRLPAPPIQKVLDFRLVEVARGYTAFSGSPKFEYYNPLGTVHGGYTAALLDSCMACDVQSTIDAGWSYATLEIKINYVRPITFDTGELRAEGKVVHSGKRTSTAEGRLYDGARKLFFSSRRRHTIFDCDWSSDVCSSDLQPGRVPGDDADRVPGGGSRAARLLRGRLDFYA